MKSKTAAHPWKLWYLEPASRWEEALPIGNGRLGGMVYGHPDTEIIALNEDTMWSGFPRDTNNYDALRHLNKAREYIAAGRYTDAEELIESKMLGRRTESYQPLGSLNLEFTAGHLPYENYYRELDLDTGIATVKYQRGNTVFMREVFVSAPDQVMLVRITADGNDPVDVTASLDTPHSHRFEVNRFTDSNDELITMQGRCPSHVADNYLGDHPQSVVYEDDKGLSFEVQVSVMQNGGQVTVGNDGKLHIRGAGSVSLLLTAGTNFEAFNMTPDTNKAAALKDRCRDQLEKAFSLGVDLLRSRHIEDHQSLFRRVDLNLGSSPNGELPTDVRLASYRNGSSDPGLEALYFQFGRYLLITSSRPGTQPANLQGIWNPHVQPPWNSDYTTNINTQMNYWPAEVTNLSECHEPLFDMIADLSVSGARTARIHYGCGGWTTHHNVDLWRAATPTDGEASWAFWPMGGVWLCRHLWEHYLYGMNENFLRETAYPLMKGAARFCTDWMVEGPGGKWITSPSTSPENKFLTEEGIPCSVSSASSMDLFMISELLGNCIQAAEILGIDQEWSQELKEILKEMTQSEIAPDGRLREWSSDFKEAEPGHRHVSHLYGLYPGQAITRDCTPELAEAARKSLDSRIAQGGGHTGWSCAWLINLFARLGDAGQAYHFVHTLLARSTYPNLFDDHPPFQIDGNFGGTAGMAEMLIQSHAGYIELLPALPSEWESGTIRGLKARGGCIVDMEWKSGQLMSAILHSTVDGSCSVRYSLPIIVRDSNGMKVSDGSEFQTQSGMKYEIMLS